MEKNNKVLAVLVIVLSILVLALGGYIVYDKVLNDRIIDNSNDNDVQDDNNAVQEENNNNNCNESTNKSEETNLLDKTKLEKYKNGDGTYGKQKSFYETDYNTHLNLVGDVEVCYQSDCHKITNISNVVDMLKWTVAGAGEAQKVLFLLDNGDLYSYAYEDYNNNNFEAKKIEGISNVDRVVEFSYGGLEKGGNWGVIAITEDNNYIEVFRESI